MRKAPLQYGRPSTAVLESSPKVIQVRKEPIGIDTCLEPQRAQSKGPKPLNKGPKGYWFPEHPSKFWREFGAIKPYCLLSASTHCSLVCSIWPKVLGRIPVIKVVIENRTLPRPD